jgi:hypothetical protein
MIPMKEQGCLGAECRKIEDVAKDAQKALMEFDKKVGREKVNKLFNLLLI